jgi:hypothetical protein
MFQAPVACTETGGSLRRWETTTNDDGWFTMTVSRYPLQCFAASSMVGVASQRVLVPSNTFPTQIDLRYGEIIGGQVSALIEGAAPVLVPSLVQVIDMEDVVRGLTLTDDDGSFDIPTAWTP